MATLKIYNDIQSEQQKAVASFWGEAEGVCFKDIDTFCNGLSEKDEDIDIRLHCDGGSNHITILNGRRDLLLAGSSKKH